MNTQIYNRNLLNNHLGRATIAGGGRKQNHIHCKLCKNDKYVNVCTVSLISLMHPMPIKFIVCVTDVTELYCSKHVSGRK